MNSKIEESLAVILSVLILSALILYIHIDKAQFLINYGKGNEITIFSVLISTLISIFWHLKMFKSYFLWKAQGAKINSLQDVKYFIGPKFFIVNYMKYLMIQAVFMFLLYYIFPIYLFTKESLIICLLFIPTFVTISFYKKKKSLNNVDVNYKTYKKKYIPKPKPKKNEIILCSIGEDQSFIDKTGEIR